MSIMTSGNKTRYPGREEKKICENELLDLAQRVLTPRQYQALLLRFESGWSYRKIADEMGITPKSAWELIQRAIKRVQKSYFSP